MHGFTGRKCQSVKDFRALHGIYPLSLHGHSFLPRSGSSCTSRRAGLLGRIATALVGGVWSLVTFFVVPILVLEDKGVVDSVKESVSLMKRTWGESIVGSGSIMLIFVATGIVGMLLVFASLLIGNMIVFGIAVVLFILLVVVLAVVASAMQGIFVTALYTYARTGTVPSAFNDDLIRNAFIPRQAGPGTI